MTQEFEFYSLADMSKYGGKWVAIVGKEVIASGDNFKQVYKEAKIKAKNKEPLFAQIPKAEETLIL
jgi:hypothetical protein